MAPSEHTDAHTHAPRDAARDAALRAVVYVVALAALALVAWSLIEGGNRDLWTQSPGLLRPMATSLAP